MNKRNGLEWGYDTMTPISDTIAECEVKINVRIHDLNREGK